MSRTDADRFLERLAALDRGELLAIQARWSSRPGERLIAARRAAVDAALERGLRDELVRVERAVRDWAARAGPVTGLESGTGTLAEVDVEARRSAGPALVDVAVGLLVGEHLPADEREALMGAWEEAIGEGETR